MKTKKVIRFYFVLFALFYFASCSKDSLKTVPIDPPDDESELIFKTGEDSVLFNEYLPLSDKPIMIHYYIPKSGNIEELPILFSMHGAERDGKIQRNAWKHLAEAHGFIVLAPQYSREHYKENDYQFAGIYESTNSHLIRDEAKWTFQSIEAIFDYFKNETKNRSQDYSIFGHSAGAQFVHRSLLAFPNARVKSAVAANPGSWTFPLVEGVDGYGWPYSIKETPFTSKNILESFFQKNIYVQIGTEDTDPTGAGVPTDAPSIAQGAHRYERAVNFFNTCGDVSTGLSVNLNFKLAEVQGVGHSTLRMVYGNAGPFDPKKVDVRGVNNAFDLIFK